MKTILLLASALALMTTSGCIVRDHRGGGEFHEHGEWRGHGYDRNYHEHSEFRREPEAGVNVRIHAD